MIEGPLGLEVRIDDEHRGFLPLEAPIWLNRGSHRIALLMNGKVTYQRTVDIKAQKTRIQRVYEDGEMMSPGPPRPEVEWVDMQKASEKNYTQSAELKLNSKTALEISAIPLLATAGTTLTIGIVTAIRAARLNADLNDACTDGVCNDNKADRIDSLENSAMATDILLISTAVLTGTAISLLIVNKRRKNR
jgi:hypothetical protein